MNLSRELTGINYNKIAEVVQTRKEIHLRKQVTIVIGFCRRDNLDQIERQGR